MLGAKAFGIVLLATFAQPVAAQDVLRLGSARAKAGETATVAVQIRDQAGTTLDSGVAGAGFHSFAVGVTVTPPDAVDSLSFVRDGTTADVAPRFETQTTASGRGAWIVSFEDPIELGSNLELLGSLEVKLAPGAAPGSVVTLAFDETRTAVSNAPASILETSGNGQLRLIEGGIEVEESTETCTSGDTLCLLDDRFRLVVRWRDFKGNEGEGRPVQLTRDSGYFWFFGPENVELAVKVLDGRAINGSFWVFYGSLSNVAFSLKVVDSLTEEEKIYDNPLGIFASVGDTSAFPEAAETSGPSAQEVPPLPRADGCDAGVDGLCLLEDRFRLTMAWENFAGVSGVGHPVQLTRDSGYFWFFGPENVELVVKVLDGTGINGRFWVFYGALSNVKFTLTVVDTVTDETKTYTNPLGGFASVGDTGAF